MRTQGNTLIIILLSITLLSGIVIALFNSIIFQVKTNTKNSEKFRQFYSAEKCISLVEKKLNDAKKNLPVTDDCHSDSCANTFQPITYESMDDAWWKTQGIQCDYDTVYYLAEYSRSIDGSSAIYQLTIHNIVNIQVFLSVDFKKSKTECLSWNEFG